jgi:hypothetical protein
MLDDKKDFTENAPGNSGGHYSGKVQPIHYLISNLPDALIANVIKYVSRYKKKNGKEDLQKALWYLNIVVMKFDGTFANSYCSMRDFLAQNTELDEDQRQILLYIDEYVDECGYGHSAERGLNLLSNIKSSIEKILKDL